MIRRDPDNAAEGRGFQGAVDSSYEDTALTPEIQVHLGDYIYESKGGGERATKPAAEIFSLHDYRTRHGQVSGG